MKDEWLFNVDVIGQALSSSGRDVSRLSAPFVGRPSALGNHLFSCISDLQFCSTNIYCILNPKNTPANNPKYTHHPHYVHSDNSDAWFPATLALQSLVMKKLIKPLSLH